MSVLRSSMLFALMTSLVFLAGCGAGPEDAKTGEPAESQQTAAPVQQDKVAVEPEKLHGTWLGVAFIDEKKLAEELANIDAGQREALIARAETFVSTVMAVQFNPDGTLSNEIEMRAPNGQPLLDSVSGKWEVLDSDGLTFLVECEETSSDGTVAKVQKKYRFYEENENNMALQLELDGILARCNPLIIFEKQNNNTQENTAARAQDLK